MNDLRQGANESHRDHDELLIARLYGHDLSEAERLRALERVGECAECAALLADFGAIAGATAALPVPSRPREFTLTPADAARFRPRRSRWTEALAGWLRPAGGVLAAAGLAGVLLVGATSALPAGSSTSVTNPEFAAGPTASGVHDTSGQGAAVSDGGGAGSAGSASSAPASGGSKQALNGSEGTAVPATAPSLAASSAVSPAPSLSPSKMPGNSFTLPSALPPPSAMAVATPATISGGPSGLPVPAGAAGGPGPSGDLGGRSGYQPPSAAGSGAGTASGGADLRPLFMAASLGALAGGLALLLAAAIVRRRG